LSFIRRNILDNIFVKSTFRLRFQGFAFGTNRWIYLSVLGSALLFTVADHLVLKIILGLVLSVTSGLVAVPLTECTLSFPKRIRELAKLYGARRICSFGLVDEFLNLANTMGVHLRNQDIVRVAPSWVNAAYFNGKIILGQTIVEEFDEESRRGVLAHELAHRKAYHPLKHLGILLLAFMPVVCLISLMQLPGIVNLLVVFAAYGLVFPIASWHFEYEADSIAAQFVGKQPVIIALLRLSDANAIDIKRDTYSHPSIAKRIHRLQKLGRSAPNGKSPS